MQTLGSLSPVADECTWLNFTRHSFHSKFLLVHGNSKCLKFNLVYNVKFRLSSKHSVNQPHVNKTTVLETTLDFTNVITLNFFLLEHGINTVSGNLDVLLWCTQTKVTNKNKNVLKKANFFMQKRDVCETVSLTVLLYPTVWGLNFKSIDILDCDTSNLKLIAICLFSIAENGQWHFL